MGSPHILHTHQLLPLLNPASAYNTAQLARNSILCNSTMEQYDAQSMLRIAHHDRSTPSVCGSTGAGIDLNQLPPSSESADELTRQAPPLLLHTTGASANARNRTSSDLGPGPIHPEPTMISYFEHERSHSNIALRACGDGDGALNARKPLRLSKEKSAVLERSFKEHNTLNPKQKIALANQLNLRPRQVEVWFQNRRARTKLKQKEVECEALKRLCEALSKENKRLQKEIVELRTLTMGGHCMSPHGFYMPLPRTTSSSCECRSPQFLVASATSTTTSRSSFNQPSNIPSSLSSHQKSSPSCS